MITAQTSERPASRCCECDAVIEQRDTFGWSIDYGQLYCQRCYWSDSEPLPPPPPARSVPALPMEPWEEALLYRARFHDACAMVTLPAIHRLATNAGGVFARGRELP